MQLWLILLLTFPLFSCLQLYGAEVYDLASNSSAPSPFLLLLRLLRYKVCIRCPWWSWPRLRKLHYPKPFISEGKQQEGFHALIIFQRLFPPLCSEQLLQLRNVKMLELCIQFSLFFLTAFFKQRIFKNFTAQDKIRKFFKELAAVMAGLQQKRHKEIC